MSVRTSSMAMLTHAGVTCAVVGALNVADERVSYRVLDAGGPVLLTGQLEPRRNGLWYAHDGSATARQPPAPRPGNRRERRRAAALERRADR